MTTSSPAFASHGETHLGSTGRLPRQASFPFRSRYRASENPLQLGHDTAHRQRHDCTSSSSRTARSSRFPIATTQRASTMPHNNMRPFANLHRSQSASSVSSSSAASGSSAVAVRPLPSEDMEVPQEMSLLSARVLRFFPEEKEGSSLRKTRFVYEIETCHHVTGEVYRAERRFREFKRLRDGLLTECSGCHDCADFVDRLKKAKLPPRGLFVVDTDKYGATRALELTHFLKDLLDLVAQHARHCKRDGADVDKSVAMFLKSPSLTEAEDLVDKTQDMVGPLKTRQDRIDFRASSMPDFRFSAGSLDQASDDALAKFRTRGFSVGELHP